MEATMNNKEVKRMNHRSCYSMPVLKAAVMIKTE